MTTQALHRTLSAAALLLAAAPLRADTLKVPSDDFATIQSAIDVAVEGDVIQVAKGIYDENLVIATAGITLKGKGATINGRYLGSCLGIAANDVTIESLTLANGGGSPALDGDLPGGVRAAGTGITLKKVTVKACENFGIRLDGTGSVESCTVDACTGEGILVATDDAAGSVTTGIIKNKVTRCQAGIILVDGPFAVDKNTCEMNVGDGLLVQILVPPVDGGEALLVTTVTRNTLRNNTEFGLSVSNDVNLAPGVVVEKNKIEDNGAGVQLEGFFISATSNTVDDNLEGGIALQATSCTLEKNKVGGNGAYGILLASAGVTDGVPEPGLNTLHQNTVDDSAADGIVVFSASNELHQNTVKDNGGDGIELLVGADDNVLVDNKVSGNGHDGIDNSGLDTIIADNSSKANGGADLAGAGISVGTVVAVESVGNVVSDDSDLEGFTTEGELDLPLD